MSSPSANTDFLAERIREVYEENELLTKETNVVLQTTDGYLWIGNYSGLHRYDGKSFTHYSGNTTEVFQTSSVVSLLEDEQ